MPLDYSLPEPTDPDAKRRLNETLRDYDKIAEYTSIPPKMRELQIFEIYEKFAPPRTVRQRLDTDLAKIELSCNSYNDRMRYGKRHDVPESQFLTSHDVDNRIRFEQDVIRHKYRRFLEAEDEAAAEQRLRETYPQNLDYLEEAFREAQWRRLDEKLPPNELP